MMEVQVLFMRSATQALVPFCSPFYTHTKFIRTFFFKPFHVVFFFLAGLQASKHFILCCYSIRISVSNEHLSLLFA